MHPVLAFIAFFRVLFGRPLPESLAPKQLPAPEPEVKERVEPSGGERVIERIVEKVVVEKPKTSTAAAQRDGALALLALLQREGRFVDFVRDSVEGASDADIGAAAREVHRGCRKVLDQHLTIEPVMPGEEEAKVSVPKGFDPAEIRLIGEAKGEPPYRGTLRHHGWRVVDAKLPSLAEGVDRAVIAPAEVELPA